MLTPPRGYSGGESGCFRFLTCSTASSAAASRSGARLISCCNPPIGATFFFLANLSVSFRYSAPSFPIDRLTPGRGWGFTALNQWYDVWDESLVGSRIVAKSGLMRVPLSPPPTPFSGRPVRSDLAWFPFLWL